MKFFRTLHTTILLEASLFMGKNTSAFFCFWKKWRENKIKKQHKQKRNINYQTQGAGITNRVQSAFDLGHILFELIGAVQNNSTLKPLHSVFAQYIFGPSMCSALQHLINGHFPVFSGIATC